MRELRYEYGIPLYEKEEDFYSCFKMTAKDLQTKLEKYEKKEEARAEVSEMMILYGGRGRRQQRWSFKEFNLFNLMETLHNYSTLSSQFLEALNRHEETRLLALIIE